MSDGRMTDRTPVPQDPDTAAVEGAPSDREFHLRRVCARFPRSLSARRLAMMAALFDDDAR
jgi:hypothetical protein